MADVERRILVGRDGGRRLSRAMNGDPQRLLPAYFQAHPKSCDGKALDADTVAVDEVFNSGR